jgi:hypothetical protein
VIENPLYPRTFHGECDLVGTGRLELETAGDVAAFVSCLACKDPDFEPLSLGYQPKSVLRRP